LDFLLPLEPLRRQLFSNLVVLYRVNVTESQVFQLPFDLPDAKAVCQRSVDFKGVLGNALLPVRGHILQRAHVMQPVSQFHNDDTEIAANRQQHFPQGLDNIFRFPAAGNQVRGLRTSDFLRVLIPAGYLRQTGDQGQVFD